LLDQRILGNSTEDYLASVLLLLAGLAITALVRRVLFGRLRAWAARTPQLHDDDAVAVAHRAFTPMAYFGVFYLAMRNLALSQAVRRALDLAGIAVLTIVVTRLAAAALVLALEAYGARKGRGTGRERAFRGFATLARVAIWGLGLLFLLDNLGLKVSTVVAGLGIGGVAVALALQAVLGDVFSYFTIMLDRPFEIGDFIIVGDHMGVFEHLGIKSTRISSLGGEQIVISNKDLTDSRVRNFKRMERRRVVFHVGVTYETSSARLRELPSLLADIVRSVPETTFDRAHFAAYGDSSLMFEVVYYVAGNDYNRYMDVQQQINLAIYDELAKRRIDLAYPTQTLYVRPSTPSL
jgi:small-conductance mechanosensitive channel